MITELQRERAALATEATTLIAKIQSVPKADPRRAEHIDRKMLVDRKLKRINADIKRWNVSHSPGTVPAEAGEPGEAGGDPSWTEPDGTDAAPGIDARDLCAIVAMHAMIVAKQDMNPLDSIWQRAAARAAWEMAENMFPDDDLEDDGAQP